MKYYHQNYFYNEFIRLFDRDSNAIIKNMQTFIQIYQKKYITQNQMQANLLIKSTPIHNNLNRKGILRKFDRRRLQKRNEGLANNNLRLDFISSQQYETQRSQEKCERSSLLSSIRCRNLRNRTNQDRRKQMQSMRDNSEDLDLRFQPVQEPSMISTARNQAKNNFDINMFLCRRTAPIRLTFSRSKTSRSNYIEKRQYTAPLDAKGLVGYQITPNSLMNRKISVFTS